MPTFDNIVVNTANNTNFKGYEGNPPTTEAEYLALDCWTDASLAPTWAEMSTAMALEAILVKRRESYNALNQFELMTDDAANSTTTHADAIAAIKAEFPKP